MCTCSPTTVWTTPPSAAQMPMSRRRLTLTGFARPIRSRSGPTSKVAASRTSPTYAVATLSRCTVGPPIARYKTEVPPIESAASHTFRSRRRETPSTRATPRSQPCLSALRACQRVVYGADQPSDCVTDDERIGKPDEGAPDRNAIAREEDPQHAEVRSDIWSSAHYQNYRHEKQDRPEKQSDGDSPCACVQTQQRRFDLLLRLHHLRLVHLDVIQEITSRVELGSSAQNEKRYCQRQIPRECDEPSGDEPNCEPPRESDERAFPRQVVAGEVLGEQTQTTPRCTAKKINRGNREDSQPRGRADSHTECALVDGGEQKCRRRR